MSGGSRVESIIIYNLNDVRRQLAGEVFIALVDLLTLDFPQQKKKKQ